MGYNIPYDSDYQDWYGVPQNVTRLSAVLEQTENEDGVPIGRITASWSIPDNGGTFNILSSTDDVNYTIEKLNVNGNIAIIDVEPNTGYYIKVVTLLGGNQSTGTTLQVPVATIPTPSAPVLTALSTGFQIDAGIIPAGYTVQFSISDGTNTEVIGSTERVTMYMCGSGSYSVTSAYVDANGNVGTYSEASTATVSAVATEQFVADSIGEYAAGTEIEENDDLDDYTTAGHYYCSDPAVVATLSNCPLADAFAMIVLNYGTSVIQVIFADNGEMYQRFGISSSWYVHTGTAVTV